MQRAMIHLKPFYLFESESKIIPYVIPSYIAAKGVVSFPAFYNKEEKTAYPCMIDIYPGYKGKGIGRLAVEDFENWAKSVGATCIKSGYGSYPNSVGFWEKLGYTVSKKKNKQGCYDFTKYL